MRVTQAHVVVAPDVFVLQVPARDEQVHLSLACHTISGWFIPVKYTGAQAHKNLCKQKVSTATTRVNSTDMMHSEYCEII